MSGCPRRYDYFDINTDFFDGTWAINVLRYNSTGSEKWTTSSFYTTLTSSHAFKVLYCPSSWESTEYSAVGGLETSNSLMATLAICGMHTCSASTLNGSGGFATYYDDFVKSSSIASGMSSYSIIDFENLSDYSSDDDINKTTNAYSKYLWCQYQNNPGSHPMPSPGLGRFDNLFEEEETLPVIIIIIASSVSLLSITALSILLIKKRKSKEQ